MFLEKINQTYLNWVETEQDPTKECFLEDIFGLTIYDSGEGSAQEYIIKKIIDVVECIASKKTFEYIEKSKDNYFNYITMVNLPFFLNKIEWGTSIRGCWFMLPIKVDRLEIQGIVINDDKELNEFMISLVKWYKV